MCDFKTGDLISVDGWSDPRVYLYSGTRNNIFHQTKERYEEGNNACIGHSDRKDVIKYEPLRFVKSAIEIMRDLIASGYEVDDLGNWNPKRGTGWAIFYTGMWKYCGKEVGGSVEWMNSWIIRK